MDISQIEKNVQKVADNLSEGTFIFDLIRAYGLPKASITRLQKGDYNLSKAKGGILWKRKLLFQVEKSSDLHELIDSLQSDAAVAKQHPRFVIVTDYQTILAVDTKLQDTLDIPIKELPRHFDFFLPWAGMEKAQVQGENPADIKAAERMGQLYDLILQNNPIKNDSDRHSLNIFFSRLLFCFFAEDTGIFPQDKFTNGLASHTREDGSDVKDYLSKLFHVLSTEERSHYPKFLQEFPYVNGGLFCEEQPVPEFTTKSRKIMIECGSLNWKAINPDIFGSMMQAVVHTDQRSGMGMHYTSVGNIMKVIEPLFLNGLYDQLESAGNDKRKLTELLNRIYHIRVFDPACGSGNFLIIAFKELCKLEIEIFKRLHGEQTSFRFESKLQLTQFFGIEIDDFAHETAKLSLWLAEHQMNVAFREVFGEARPTLPLQDGGNILCANATQVDWGEFCPRTANSEIYVLGNPPYRGYSVQSASNKEDMKTVFQGEKQFKNLDYIASWFFLAANYARNSNVDVAFVSTNSVCQGEQVSALWPKIFAMGLQIHFAHTSFKWSNNARGKAAVICVVIGMSTNPCRPKQIFQGGVSHTVKNITPYLTSGPNRVVSKSTHPVSLLPVIERGSSPVDGGHLLLTEHERQQIVNHNPECERFIKPFMGSLEFINDRRRYCLRIPPSALEEARAIPNIRDRLERVRQFRLESKKASTRQKASSPHLFVEDRYKPRKCLIVPRISSERRLYIPSGFLDGGTVISDLAFAIYDPPPWIFALISSRMHMTWVRAVAGRMKTDYRYSSALCYNTFPFPEISEKQKSLLEKHAFAVLDVREEYSEKTLADLYDPNEMPRPLKDAHKEMDLVVERCYRIKPFESDELRLECLLGAYEKICTGKPVQGDLYA